MNIKQNMDVLAFVFLDSLLFSFLVSYHKPIMTWRSLWVKLNLRLKNWRCSWMLGHRMKSRETRPILHGDDFLWSTSRLWSYQRSTNRSQSLFHGNLDHTTPSNSNT